MNKPVPFTRGKIVILYVSMILIVAVAIAFCIWVVNENVAQELAAREQAARAAMQPVCQLLDAFRDGYAETPPSTPAGVRQQQAINTMYNTFQCSSIPTE